MIIHIGTSNEGKFREMSRMLEALDHSVVKEHIPYPEIQAETLQEVVQFAIPWILENDRRSWMDHPDHGFIIDDSGIFIKAVKDFPGVYSKFVFYTIGNRGILQLLEGNEYRNASFKTVLMFHSKGRNHYFDGVSNGRIAQKERGNHGFGYDPIFIPEGSEKTFAEMDISEKNAFSHRGEAMDKFTEFLSKMKTY